MGFREFFKSDYVKKIEKDLHGYHDRLAEAVDQIDDLKQKYSEGLDFSFNRNTDTTTSNTFRRLGANFTRDMLSNKLCKVFDAVVDIAHKNPVAEFLINTTADFIIGDGFKYVAVDEDVQKVLDKFVEVNRLDLTAHDKARELGIFGEQCYRVFVNETTGLVRIGIVDPQNIKQIIADPKDISRLLNAVIAINSGTNEQKDETLEIIKQNDSGALEGEVFFFKINTVTSVTRGLSDLYNVIDYVDGFDKVLFNSIERTAFMNAFFLDVTITNGKEKEINEHIKNNPPPRPGTRVVHNEQVKYEFMTPDLQANELTIQLKFLLSIIVGTKGFSLPWLGIGDDTNRATAQEMAVPSMKRLQRRQDFVKEMYRQMGEFAIQQAKLSKNNTLSQNADMTFTVEMSPLSQKDVETASKSFKDVVAGVSLAKSSGLMSEPTAIKAVIKATDNLDIETELEDEIEAIKAERIKSDQELTDKMMENGTEEETDEAGD